MNTHNTPLWLIELRRREMEGNTELRQRLTSEWKKHVGMTDEMASQLLDGVSGRSNIIDHIAAWVLDIPEHKALRTCEHCAWQGNDSETGDGYSCPQCGHGTYCLPPVF